jgi:hypothetical protein
LRSLELYGGKANLLLDELRRWFIGLWQGKTLAFTLCGMTILLSLGIRYLGRHLPSQSEGPHQFGGVTPLAWHDGLVSKNNKQKNITLNSLKTFPSQKFTLEKTSFLQNHAPIEYPADLFA